MIRKEQIKKKRNKTNQTNHGVEISYHRLETIQNIFFSLDYFSKWI